MTTNTRVQAFKKNLIIETARSLFIADSFDAVTVEEIAKAAGFGKSTVYQFFDSKEEILNAVLQMGLEQLSSQLYEFNARENDPETILRYYIALQYVFFREYGNIFFTFLQKCKIKAVKTDWAEEIRQLTSQKILFLSQVLQRGVEEGLFIPADSNYFSWFISSMIKGVCMPSFMRSPELQDKEKDIEMLEAVILKGILLKP